MPDLALPHGLTPALMEELGCVMRESLRGMIDLLVARAEAKREVRADATIIVAQDNNPLKFAPDLDAVVQHLLQPRGKGFMPPLAAIRDAQESLRSHQVGFVAGMRAALETVVARFDPARTRGAPDRHRARRTRCCRSITAPSCGRCTRNSTGRFRTRPQTDFHHLFGEEFLRAYQAKVDAQRERRDAAGAT